MFRPALRCLAAFLLLLAPASSAFAQVTVFDDRTLFTAALAGLGTTTTDDYESYALGPITEGDVRGDFRYTFDANVTQPAVVVGGNGGQALGGSPFDVFVGGDSVTLGYSPTSPASGQTLLAFGADFLYAPSFDTIPADTYRLGIGDGTAAGQFAGNLDSIDPSGGTFFLGLIAAPSAAFRLVDLFSVQPDPAFLVPAYQVDNLAFVAVPEPGASTLSLALGAFGGLLLRARARRRS